MSKLDAIDRERDEAFRRHMRDEHGYETDGSQNRLLQIANGLGARCQTCETYALSVGSEEA